MNVGDLLSITAAVKNIKSCLMACRVDGKLSSLVEAAVSHGHSSSSTAVKQEAASLLPLSSLSFCFLPPAAAGLVGGPLCPRQLRQRCRVDLHHHWSAVRRADVCSRLLRSALQRGDWLIWDRQLCGGDGADLYFMNWGGMITCLQSALWQLSAGKCSGVLRQKLEMCIL